MENLEKIIKRCIKEGIQGNVLFVNISAINKQPIIDFLNFLRNTHYLKYKVFHLETMMKKV